MKISIALLVALLFSATSATAEDEDTQPSRTLTIEGGKFIGEEKEIEIYDYHTGTYQTVTVYRKPAQDDKQPAVKLPAEPSKR